MTKIVLKTCIFTHFGQSSPSPYQQTIIYRMQRIMSTACYHLDLRRSFPASVQKAVNFIIRQIMFASKSVLGNVLHRLICRPTTAFHRILIRYAETRGINTTLRRTKQYLPTSRLRYNREIFQLCYAGVHISRHRDPYHLPGGGTATI